MTLSTTKRTSSISSVTNQPQGGGSKKAGLPPAHNVATFVAFHERGYPRSAAFMSTMMPNVCVSRPIGMIVNVGRMKC